MEFITQEIFPFIKHHPLLTIGWIVLFCFIIYMTIKAKFSKVKMVNSAQAIQLVNRCEGVFIDLRKNDNFRKGHIVDAINCLPIDIKNGSTQAINKYKAVPIILVDDNGLTVNATGEILVKQGFEQVYSLKDGMASWLGEKLPLVKK